MNDGNIPEQPLATGYGPASAALRAELAQRMENSNEGVHIGGGALLFLGLRGGAGEESGEEQPEQSSGRGHWGVGRRPSARWTNEQDLELLRIINEYPFWTADFIANELNLRILENDPDAPQRSDNAVRQRRKKLEKSGVTIADLEARCNSKGDGGEGRKDGGDGGAAGGAAGAVVA